MVYAIIMPVYGKADIDLKASKRPVLLLNREYAQVYKPTKLIIGKENIFIIKGKAGSFVSLAYSYSNKGSQEFYGQELRLGSDFKTIEGVIPSNGLLELRMNLPKDNTLALKTMFFEVAVWTKKDFSDVELAIIIAPNGRETDSNDILVALPPDNPNKPTISPSIPGTSIDAIKTMQAFQNLQQSINTNMMRGYDDYDRGYNTDDGFLKPNILRNMDAPELSK